MRSARWVLAIVFAAACCDVGISTAQESSQQVSVRAQEECDLGRRAHDRRERLAHFVKSQKLAERAVALDDRNADAHFALFCALGEQSRIDGEKSAAAVLAYPKVVRELDRTLELNPEHLDALSSKGAFLILLPKLAGGNVERGERILEHVIIMDPRSINARLGLAKSYVARGKEAEALTLATEALELARADGRDDLIPEAEAAISKLRRPAS